MVLYEHFNSTNQTRPFFQRHDILVHNISYDDCGFVHEEPIKEQCKFVRTNPNCRNDDYLQTYMWFVYCGMGSGAAKHFLANFILIFFLVFLFALITEVVGRFLIPALTALAKIAQMGETLTGVTLLAFGNGAADLFSAWADIRGDTTPVYTSIFGSVLFIVAIISAVIILIRPFRPYPPYIVRDLTFLLYAITYVDYVMLDGTVNVYESALIISIYVLYVLVLIIDQIRIVRLKHDLEEIIEKRQSARSLDEGILSALAQEGRRTQGSIEVLQEEMTKVHEANVLEIFKRNSQNTVDVETTRPASFIGSTPNSHLILQFGHTVNPFHHEQWEQAGLLGKAFQIMKCPFIVIFYLLIPVVDFGEPNHGWSKLLNTLQLGFSPFTMLLIFYISNAWPYVFLTTLGISLGLVVHFTSRTDHPPTYHWGFSIFSIIICVAVINKMIQHISSIFEVLAIACHTSPSFLSITVVSWGSGMANLITNAMLAKQGYHQMGFAACIGGPIFNITIAFGVNFLVKCLTTRNHIGITHKGSMGPNIFLFLVCVIVFILCSLGFTKFRLRRSLAIYSIATYCIFFISILLVEFETIHGYGSDHHDQRIRLDK